MPGPSHATRDRTLSAPIRSLRSEDPAIEEALDRFILTLGERLDALQDAEAACDFGLLKAHAEAFSASADELGFPPLVDALAQVMAAAEAESEPEARKTIQDLGESLQRVRRGHHSAA